MRVRQQQMSGSGSKARRAFAFLLVTAVAVGCSQPGDPVASSNDLATGSIPVESDGAPGTMAHGEGSTGSSTVVATAASPTTAVTTSNPTVSADKPTEQPVNLVAPEDTQPEGSSSWAVVVAGASDPYDTLLEDTVAELSAAGFSALITNCDHGAADALQMSPAGTFTVSVYYDSEAAAAQGVTDLAAAGIAGVATPIETSCPD